MSATEVLGRYSQAGFYETPISKCLVGWICVGHAFLQVPMVQGVQKYLVCKVPDSFAKGEFWRLLTSRIAFIDTKDAVLAALIVYSFRMFERRLGTRKFFSRLVSAFFLSTFFEVALTYAVTSLVGKPDVSGLLSVGPLAAVFPWFVPFLHDVPKMRSGSIGGSFMTPKLLTYVGGFHILASSKANLIAGLSCLAAGLMLRHNVLWSQKWFSIPDRLASLTYRLLGRWIASGPPVQGMMGATIEIQRAQQMEALEQQMIRQQVRFAEAGGRHRRAQVGQGFAERLVDDAGLGGAWGPFQIPRQNHQQLPPARQQPPPPPVVPSEENIRLLMDMGFSRDRVETALTRSNNDVQLATTVLLQDA